MKLWYLLLILVLLGATCFIRVEVNQETTGMGWPLPWIEAVETVNGNTTTISYNIVLPNLIINAAVYAALIWLILG